MSQQSSLIDWEGFIQTLGQSPSSAAFWVGFSLVVVFAINRFDLSEESSDAIDPPVVARSFTTRFRYYLSATAYVGFFEFFFILLVGIGSFPFLQDLLTELIGSLEITGRKIGTPAWAALVATSLLPSTPGFRTIDKQVRNFLHRFASIPYKARALANEILEQLAQPPMQEKELVVPEGLSDKDRCRIRQLTWLSNAVETLQDGAENPTNASQYSSFFSRYSKAFKQASKKEKEFFKTLQNTKESSPLIEHELNTMVIHMSRFLSCALFQIEPSERDVRNTIRERLELAGLTKLEFSFSGKQIILGFILMVFLTFAFGVGVLWVVAANQEPAINMTGPMVLYIASWIPYATLMLVPPFILAAGVQLYFMDQRQLKSRELPWEDKFFALTALFTGAFALGVLPSLAGMAVKGQIQGAEWMMQVFPFGLIPAVLAIVFYTLATHCPIKSVLWSTLLGFFLFALTSGLCTWFATYVAIIFGLNIPELANVPEFSNEMALHVFPWTAAALAGVLGTIQCGISRREREALIRADSAATTAELEKVDVEKNEKL